IRKSGKVQLVLGKVTLDMCLGTWAGGWGSQSHAVIPRDPEPAPSWCPAVSPTPAAPPSAKRGSWGVWGALGCPPALWTRWWEQDTRPGGKTWNKSSVPPVSVWFCHLCW
uniref:Uncharacterized protein n=1 Tax=Zonotrichia albicollis TaxID=44394 RepID=A0A8D2QAG1_ZONAL